MALLRKTNKTVDLDTENRVLNDDSSFVTVETYKDIRTNVRFSMPKTEKGKVIVITSAAPGEGKTTTSINLAITFAQMGAKVILVDCDLRKSRVHRYLKLDRKNGITNVLCGFSQLDKAIKRNVRENLDVLPSGETPPNPVELMETEEYGKLISELQEKYDYIFIDTPPITVVTDAAVAMKYSMGAIVVVRHNSTTFDMMDIAMEKIGATGVKVVGAIMVGSEEKRTMRGSKSGKYGYKYKYNYSYDYKYEDNEADK